MMTLAYAQAMLRHALKNANRAPQAAADCAVWIANGMPVTDTEKVSLRRQACSKCEHWKPIEGTEMWHCDVCKCPAWKIEMATAKCPLDKWPNPNV